MGADVATIAIPDRDESSLVIEVADGARADELRGLVFPVEGSISGEVVRIGRPIVIADASADPRAHQPVVGVGRVGPAMFVPLSIRERAFGTLVVANGPGGRQFDEDDLTIVETFAGQASVALEYARAQRELRRLAVMEDRERIAKELHDGVIQSPRSTALSATFAITSSGCARGSSPTGSSTRPCATSLRTSRKRRGSRPWSRSKVEWPPS